MIVVMKNNASEDEIARVTDALVKKGMQVQNNQGVDCTVLGVLGDTYMAVSYTHLDVYKRQAYNLFLPP